MGLNAVCCYVSVMQRGSVSPAAPPRLRVALGRSEVHLIKVTAKTMRTKPLAMQHSHSLSARSARRNSNTFDCMHAPTVAAGTRAASAEAAFKKTRFVISLYTSLSSRCSRLVP
eukprot:CAMPEP_0119380086 /NCGR_PEP_ID=MMETSP1334-20130426/55477_1 /TAXON_ID=127549 /ORGANISM="Calcidiscus leptoporus, Strain RCC1130" /LENGTH=113 /DNA_ID=CAMNT_0007399799 /DNA_START=186 /DNA_END=525 /DNA_ORIENTATION=-